MSQAGNRELNRAQSLEALGLPLPSRASRPVALSADASEERSRSPLPSNADRDDDVKREGGLGGGTPGALQRVMGAVASGPQSTRRSMVRKRSRFSMMGYAMPDFDGNEERVSTGVRLRPQLPFERAREEAGGGGSCVSITPPDRVLLTDPQSHQSREFKCDFALDSSSPGSNQYSDQQAVYNAIGARIIEHALRGFNCCLCAYGQTGTGKTHTVFGDWFNDKERGLLPRLTESLFTRVDTLRGDNGAEAKIHVSYLEIYNNHLRDLCKGAQLSAANPATPSSPSAAGVVSVDGALHYQERTDKRDGGRLKIRTNPAVGVFVENLSEFAVHRPADVSRLVALGERTRRTAATALNSNSSRSHTIFWLKMELHGNRSSAAAGDSGGSSMATILVVDLAGRENEQATEVVGERFQELTFINKSLFQLANCVHALSEGDGQHVPFRNSKLTTLLSDSFNRNSRTCLLATLTPSFMGYDENLLTCRFLESTGRITTYPVANILRPEELQEDLDGLRAQLREPSRGSVRTYSLRNAPTERPPRAASGSGGDGTEDAKSGDAQTRRPSLVKQACDRVGESLRKASGAMEQLDKTNAKVAASLGQAESRLSAMEAIVRAIVPPSGAPAPTSARKPRRSVKLNGDDPRLEVSPSLHQSGNPVPPRLVAPPPPQHQPANPAQSQAAQLRTVMQQHQEDVGKEGAKVTVEIEMSPVFILS